MLINSPNIIFLHYVTQAQRILELTFVQILQQKKTKRSRLKYKNLPFIPYTYIECHKMKLIFDVLHIAEHLQCEVKATEALKETQRLQITLVE